jgi:hypothetical protein
VIYNEASHFQVPMTLNLDLSPEILDRLTQGAVASGVSLETYTIQVLAVSAPALDPIALPMSNDRDQWIQQRRESRQSIVTSGPALSQTVIESRNGERY